MYHSDADRGMARVPVFSSTDLCLIDAEFCSRIFLFVINVPPRVPCECSKLIYR